MNYQQPQSAYSGTGKQRPRVNVRGKLLLTDPTLVAANQQGIITPEQLDMLARKKYAMFGGCLLVSLGTLMAVFLGVELIMSLFQGVFNILSLKGAILPLALIAFGWIWMIITLTTRKRFKASVIASGFFPIEQAQGEVLWDHNHYKARVSTQFLQVAGMSLQPGPYLFYYVSEGGIILSAQPLYTNTPMQPLSGMSAAPGLPNGEQACLAILHALCQVLNFTPADLEANRQGYITNEQIRRLHIRRTTMPPVVHNIEGEVTIDLEGDGGDSAVIYYYVIGGLRIQGEGNSRVSNALVKGIRYRMYYLVPNKSPARLLSIEPLQVPRR